MVLRIPFLRDGYGAVAESWQHHYVRGLRVARAYYGTKGHLIQHWIYRHVTLQGHLLRHRPGFQ
eukprot:1394746-Amphidinium_carterae.1